LYDPTPNTALRFDSHGAAIIDISKTRIRTRESSTTSVYTRRLGPLSVKHSTVDVYTTELPPAQVVLQGSVVPSFEAKGCAPDGNTAARIDFDFKQRDYSVTDMELPIDCHSVEAETLTSFNILGVTYDVTH